MRKDGILVGLVALGLTAVVLYYLDIGAGLTEPLQPFIRQATFVTVRASEGIRQSETWVTVADHLFVSMEYVHRGIEQLPSDVTVALSYLRSMPWMDHVNTTKAAGQQAYAMGTAALAATKHAVFVLERATRATTPPEIAPYIMFSIILLVLLLVRLVLLVIIRIIQLLVFLIGVALHGAGMLALWHALYRAFFWLLVCTFQTLALPVKALNAVFQFLARSLAVSLSHAAVRPDQYKDQFAD